ncbi:MAG: glycine cleavage system protein GcvH [Bacteriovoracaceae bacterium]|nr:glycine cleavage system protein GcvH [Bacteriovoracaceae bacterium]
MSTQIPKNLKYTKEHEWILIEGDTATVGITDFAQSALGDIVFCETPEVGTELAQGKTFGVVESIKSVSDLYSPVSGTVIEKNSDVEGSPEKINSNAYESWLIKVKVKNPGEISQLMTAEAYDQFCQTSA